MIENKKQLEEIKKNIFEVFSRKSLTDEYLKQYGGYTRKTYPEATEMIYGICHVRDNIVEDLINYYEKEIKTLEDMLLKEGYNKE